jgi:hypothetical protein
MPNLQDPVIAKKQKKAKAKSMRHDVKSTDNAYYYTLTVFRCVHDELSKKAESCKNTGTFNIDPYIAFTRQTYYHYNVQA